MCERSVREALTLPLAALGTGHWAPGARVRDTAPRGVSWVVTHSAAAALAATRQTPCSGCDSGGDGGGDTFVGTDQLASFVHGSRRPRTASQVGREWTAVVGRYTRSPLKPRTRLCLDTASAACSCEPRVHVALSPCQQEDGQDGHFNRLG